MYRSYSSCPRAGSNSALDSVTQLLFVLSRCSLGSP
jgi:hypothetical protein